MTDEASRVGGADDTIDLGSKKVLRFHPLHKRIRDNVPRCISCGQIDEPDFHEAEWCPGMGGWLPFPTATLKTELKADKGFRSSGSQRITLEQWVAINRILADNSLAQRVAKALGDAA